MEVALNGHASRQGTVFGGHLIADSFDLQAGHIHVIVLFMRSDQAII